MFLKFFTLIFLLFSSNLFAESDERMWQEYNEGVKKAFEFKNLPQKGSLFNINSSNTLIKVKCNPFWACIGGTDNWENNGLFKENVRVQVVTLISSKNNLYDSYAGKNRPYKTSYGFVWVTAAPQLEIFCKEIKDKKNLKLNLEKFLGLLPYSDKGEVVIMWVRPNDLIRPCYSTKIYTSNCPLVPDPKLDPKFKTWLDETWKNSYDNIGKRYPFTKRGFAYYWGNPNTQVGGSEYIIERNSHVFIEASDYSPTNPLKQV